MSSEKRPSRTKLLPTRSPRGTGRPPDSGGSSPRGSGYVSTDLRENRKYLEETLGAESTFDVLLKDIQVAGRPALIVAIDGFVKDDILLWVMRTLISLPPETDLRAHLIEKIPHPEITPEPQWSPALSLLLSGTSLLLVDGIDLAYIIDTRTYPARDPQEPDLEKVMRGPRDGFAETLVLNVALIRRRLRDPSLRAELHQVGRRSVSDVALMYLEDVANPDIVDDIRERVTGIDIDGLLMAEKSLEEYMLTDRQWWNPFPLVRYTERPDTAAVHLMEGGVVLSVDTSPVHIIMPATFFHHMQHAEEYHSDVLVGTFVRAVRMIALFLSWILPPLWVATALSHDVLPPALHFVGPREEVAVPLFLQFIIGELGVELIRLGLIHTPAALATALGIIGAILLGELAVEVGLFNPEVILYIVLAALGSFAVPSQELRMAVRVWRVFLLVAAGLGRLPGLAVAAVINLLALGFTRSFRVSYLWPLIPFDRKALWSVLVRKPVPLDRFRPAAYKPQDKVRQKPSS